MEIIPIVSLLLGLAGALLAVIVKYLSGRKPKSNSKIPAAVYYRKSSGRIHTGDYESTAGRVVSSSEVRAGQRVLQIFMSAVVLFGIVTLIVYRRQVFASIDVLLFSFWLFIVMVAGMFVQVISENYRQGSPLFTITISKLVYPLLFSVIVYYPVWALCTTSPGVMFSIYSAFLNGYFWQTVVSSASSAK
ncbi:MAG: hypothetical protein ACM3SM_04235 [Bacteroidota bacterium]